MRHSQGSVSESPVCHFIGQPGIEAFQSKGIIANITLEFPLPMEKPYLSCFVPAQCCEVACVDDITISNMTTVCHILKSGPLSRKSTS